MAIFEPSYGLQGIFTSLRCWYVDDEVQRSRLFKDINQNSVQASVRKIYEGKEFLGSFVFLSEDIGACAFHCVIQGKTILQDTLTVDGASVQHIISYPYYDLSFYYIPNKPDQTRFLSLAPTDSIIPGDEFVLASHAPYDGEENDCVDLSYGHVSGVVLNNSALVAANYTSFHGCSGGAVLSLRGELLGIHMESMYTEKPFKGFLMQDEEKWRPAADNITIEYPNLHWCHGGRANKEVQKLNQNQVHIPAGFAALNVPSKASVASFLPIYQIRHKFITAKHIRDSRMMRN